MPVDQNATDTTIERFVRTWFDLLSGHAPVQRLLQRVSDSELEMAFPERTLRSHADVVDWYAVVGTSFSQQDHTLEQLSSRPRGEGLTDVDLTVVWTAVRTADSARLAFRARQSWTLRTPPGAEPVIVRYRVLALDPI